MKKLFVILIALALLVGVSTPAFAAEAGVIAYAGGIGLGTLRSVTVTNTSNTETITVLPTANKEFTSVYTEPGIIPGKVKILGYDVMCVGGSGAQNFGVGTIYDCISSSTAPEAGDIIAETEAFPDMTVGRMFPMGMVLKYGLTVYCGSRTSVTVYYVQDQG